jgi:eukaryotic-like serine/threonine-protein kinase
MTDLSVGVARNRFYGPERAAQLRVSPLFCLTDTTTVRVCETLGNGTLGRVIRAEWLGLSVAIKLLRPLHEIADPQTRAHAAADFANEINVNARLGWHPNTVAFLATAREKEDAGSGVGIVFEVVRGGQLDVRRLGLSKLTRVLEIGLGIARAVAHAHRMGIMHRDIKPSNVLMTGPDTNSGEPKLCDWGLATDVEAVRKEKNTGTACFSKLMTAL